MNKRELEYQTSGRNARGVVVGLVARMPASGLTITYDGGVVRVGSGNITSPTVEKVVASSTIAVTASKDNYLYVDSTGALTKIVVTTGAAKPTAADIGVNSEFIAKVPTDGSNALSVSDIRKLAPHGEIRSLSHEFSFEANEKGDGYYIIPFSGRLLAVYGVVLKAIAGTDTATLTCSIGSTDTYTAVTTGVVTFGISDAIAVRQNCFPTALNVAKEGNYLKVTSAKSTAGGIVNVTFVWEVYP